MSFLDTLIYGYRTVYSAAVEITRRSKLNFGAGLVAVDNASTGMTDVTASGAVASISGTPAVGNVPRATSASAAAWGALDLADTDAVTGVLPTGNVATTLSSKTLASPTVTGTVTYQGTKLRALSIPGEVQTTTATTAVIATFTMLDETSCKIDFIAGMKAVGAVAKAGGWTGSATYYRTGGGAPTLAGAAAYGTAEETTAGDGVTFDVSGNAVRVLATAADGDDRNWTCEMRVAETLATA